MDRIGNLENGAGDLAADVDDVDVRRVEDVENDAQVSGLEKRLQSNKNVI
jgi:hypothetical protein